MYILIYEGGEKTVDKSEYEAWVAETFGEWMEVTYHPLTTEEMKQLKYTSHRHPHQ